MEKTRLVSDFSSPGEKKSRRKALHFSKCATFVFRKPHDFFWKMVFRKLFNIFQKWFHFFQKMVPIFWKNGSTFLKKRFHFFEKMVPILEPNRIWLNFTLESEIGPKLGEPFFEKSWTAFWKKLNHFLKKVEPFFEKRWTIFWKKWNHFLKKGEPFFNKCWTIFEKAIFQKKSCRLRKTNAGKWSALRGPFFRRPKKNRVPSKLSPKPDRYLRF